MADGVAITAGSGTNVATDDVAGIGHVQRVKLVDGSLDSSSPWGARATTATLTNVASSATSVTLLSATTARLGATIYNDSTQVLYVKFGTTASASSFTVKMQPDGYYEVPSWYSGRIDGIWSAAAGNARITELT